MKLMKTGIVEYIVVFVGMVGSLAYILVTAEAYQPAAAVQASPMLIEAGRPIRGDAGQSAVRFREVALADARV